MKQGLTRSVIRVPVLVCRGKLCWGVAISRLTNSSNHEENIKSNYPSIIQVYVNCSDLYVFFFPNLLYINKCFTTAKCWQSFCLLPLCPPPLFYFSVPLLYCSSALPFLYMAPHFLSTPPHHPQQFALLEFDGMLFKVVQPAQAWRACVASALRALGLH